MSGVRLLCVWLAVMVAAAPSWLDGCLVNCHEASAAAVAVPPCHDEAESDPGGQAWQATDNCHHDHDATWVAAPDPRQSSGLRLALAAPSWALILPSPFSLRPTRDVPVVSPPSTHSASVPLPLRL